MSKVTVYKVRAYDIVLDDYRVSRRLATPDGAAKMGGQIIEGSGREIDASNLEAGAQWTARDYGEPPVWLRGFSPRKISRKPS